MKVEFSRKILKNAQISYFTKIRPVGAESFHADRRTYMTKIIRVFLNFQKAPKSVAK